MIHLQGYWWPDGIREKDISFAFNQVKHASGLLEHVKRKGLIIQAGGCIGLYPLEYAQHFDRVLTFEANFENHACLLMNVKDHPLGKKVSVAYGALTETTGPVCLEPHHYATHRIGEYGHRVSGWSLDEKYGYLIPDAIQLDVEGHELEVLKGAERMIKEHRPVIQCEELKTDNGEVAAFLLSLGYTRLERKVGKDRIYVP